MSIKLIGDKTPIDPEIKPLIVELNKKGFVTMGSCAGHGKYGAGLGPQRKGYIWFTKSIIGNNRVQVVSLVNYPRINPWACNCVKNTLRLAG